MLNMETLPPEIALQIMSYLNLEDILALSKVDALFNNLSKDDLLWKELCRRKWIDKQSTLMQLAHRFDYQFLINSLTLAEMKLILDHRHINTSSFLNKSEWIQSVLNTTPESSPHGEWFPKWKASYIAKHLDSLRNSILLDELVSIDWYLKLMIGR